MATGASLSNHSENLLLDWLLTNASVSRPTNRYLALFSDEPGITQDQPLEELSSSNLGYSRIPVVFSTAQNGMASNIDPVSYTAESNWETATYVGIMDAQTSGHLLFWGALSTPKTLTAEDQLQFASNSIKIYLD